MSSEKVNPVKQVFEIQKYTRNNQGNINDKKEKSNEGFESFFDEENKKIMEKEQKKKDEKIKKQKAFNKNYEMMYNCKKVKRIKNDDDREKGSATVIVLVTVLFLLMILGTIFTTMALKNKSQLAELSELKIVYDGDMKTIYEERNDGIYKFNYTGAEQTFVASKAGYYLLEAWGAEGGSSTNSGNTNKGGYGGYSEGVVKLSANQTLYINVGGKGASGTTSSAGNGGYNGGGNGTLATYDSVIRAGGGGGGATHIALSSGVLSSLSGKTSDILIVAGGAGGGMVFNSPYNKSDGGSGGGYIGGEGKANAGNDIDTNGWATGGTQTSGGSRNKTVVCGEFGKGYTLTTNAVGGGGGGFYGGGANSMYGGGGGSGYIGNSLLLSYNEYTKHMTGYNITTSTDTATKTTSTTNVSEEPKKDYAKLGNGYVKITFIGE